MPKVIYEPSFLTRLNNRYNVSCPSLPKIYESLLRLGDDPELLRDRERERGRGRGRERERDREAELYEALRARPPRFRAGDALRVYDRPRELDRESRLLRTGDRDRESCLLRTGDRDRDSERVRDRERDLDRE
jgi:hypothetical protein